MKQIKLYVCELCGTQFANKADAEKCEKFHRFPKLVTPGSFKPFTMNGDGYPDKVLVNFDDGSQIQYRR